MGLLRRCHTYFLWRRKKKSPSAEIMWDVPCSLTRGVMNTKSDQHALHANQIVNKDNKDGT